MNRAFYSLAVSYMINSLEKDISNILSFSQNLVVLTNMAVIIQSVQIPVGSSMGPFFVIQILPVIG